MEEEKEVDQRSDGKIISPNREIGTGQKADDNDYHTIDALGPGWLAPL
jgi:hypothetical protein